MILFQATFNIVFDRVGKVDPVTRGIEIAVNYLGIQFDVRYCFGYKSIAIFNWLIILNS